MELLQLQSSLSTFKYLVCRGGYQMNIRCHLLYSQSGSHTECLSNVTNVPKTHWFHSIKLKLFKLIFINRFNDYFWNDSFSKSKQSKRACKLNFKKVLNWLNEIKLLAQCVFLGHLTHLGDSLYIRPCYATINSKS